MNDKKQKISEEELALSFYKLLSQINDLTIEEKIKDNIKKDITKLQKECNIKPLPNNTITILKKLGVI